MIRYRAATVEDAALLRAMVQDLADLGDPVEVGSVESLCRYGFGPRPLFHAILAEQAGDAVGMVLFYPDFSTHRGKPGVYVQDLFVTAPCRGLGVGRVLMAEAMREGANAWDAAYITLGVLPENHDARRFYAGHGFTPRGYDALILEGAGLATLMNR